MAAEMEVKQKKIHKKKGVRKVVRTQEGRISSRGSDRRMEGRNRNHCYSVGKEDRGRSP
jgi:hypothetical protein